MIKNRKWIFVLLPLFFIMIAGFALPSYFLANANSDIDRLKEVASQEGLGFAQGGPAAMQSASLVFFSGVRSASPEGVTTPESFYGYGEGPTEPSLASTLGSSLLKQSPALTIATPENSRSEVIKYTVKPGDSPSVIAASFGITANTLLWANNLSDGEYIKPGDELIILPVSGVRYKVQSGDTVSGIASQFKGEIPEIIAFNDLDEVGGIIDGDYIIIPDGEKPVRVYTGYAAKYTSNLQNLDDYFIHPTAGVGYRSRGIHLTNAVDIAASCWTPIYAAAQGTVSISDGYGWNGGYGRYVKIDHPNGTKTVYAHNIQNEVSVGQNVDQGQLIAYMGSSGRSTGCHVHWEVYGALNPLR
jgi:LysM repeat protein